MGRNLAGNTAFNFITSIFMLVIMCAIVFLSVSVVFGDGRIESVLPLIGVVLVAVAAIFIRNSLKKRL
jgi:cytochrome c biogenesis factor